MTATVHRTLTAFMEDPDADKPNPIHSTATARQFGFQGALVGGATVYGWTVRAILAALGPAWLDHGWVQLRFRRPVYPGDGLSVSVSGDRLTVFGQPEVRIEGHVGLGDAPFLADLVHPNVVRAGGWRQPRPPLALDNAPVGLDLAAMSATESAADARTRAVDGQGAPLGDFLDPGARVHPSWLAERLIHLLHQSFDYGPSVHTASLIQHLEPAYAGHPYTVAGRCVDAYERRGHHYIVNDGAVLAASGIAVAWLRHTAIFRISAAT